MRQATDEAIDEIKALARRVGMVEWTAVPGNTTLKQGPIAVASFNSLRLAHGGHPERDQARAAYAAATSPMAMLAVLERLEAAEEALAATRDDSRLLALAVKGVTPDRNTQTEAEADATDDEIDAAVRRALKKDDFGLEEAAPPAAATTVAAPKRRRSRATAKKKDA